MHITPKIGDALRAIALSPTLSLARCSGGYRPAGVASGLGPSISMRTVRAMDRAYLVRLVGQFGSAAELTEKGHQALAQLQQHAAQARAG